MNVEFKNQGGASLRHRIAAEIRGAVLSGKLRPGEKLREMELAERMGVSRGPVREALRDLEAMGLIVALPYRETAVADVSRDEVETLLIPIRLQVELHALRNRPDSGDEHFSAKLKAIVAPMRAAARRKDIATLVERDIAFHEAVVAAGGNAFSLRIWNSIVNRLRIHFVKNTALFPELERVPAEHEALIAAIEANRFRDLKEAWTRHIRDRDSLLCFDPEFTDGPSTGVPPTAIRRSAG